MKRVYHVQPDILQKPVECCYALGLICFARNCNEAGARVARSRQARSREKSTCVSDCHQCFALAMMKRGSLTQTFLADVFSLSI